MLTIVCSRTVPLNGQRVDDDTDGMESPTLPQSPFESRCLAVLDCYAVRDAAAKAAGGEYSGWLDRTCEVTGIESTELTTIHGHLIAQGLIRIEFSSRHVGLQYQLSPSGRDAIARRSCRAIDDARGLESAA